MLLDSSQETYLTIYRVSDRSQRLLESKNRFISLFPRYALEALGLFVIAVLGGFLVVDRGSGAAVIPLLGSLALGAQRLLPALQQIYSGWANLKSWSASIAAVVDMLEQPLPKHTSSVEPRVLQQKITLHNVHFRYSQELPDVIHSLDLEIRKGERIGLIGSTGCGKSTLVDLLMGLLPPTCGQLLVDGVDLYDSENPELLLGWRSTVAHVPQNIYLADSSIAENIAFGVPVSSIDMERVKRASQQAQISSFIESCPEGYASFVGERGVRLSGGQQRLGIARALYKDASIIVLDEATSALDTDTENAVMDAVENLSRNLTLVMIAHRLSTVQRCDRVIKLKSGSVSADGPPQKVLFNIP